MSTKRRLARRENYKNGEEIGLKETGCDGCDPAMINGTLCHEHGCEFAWKDHKVKCLDCGLTFYPESRYQRTCSDCLEDHADQNNILIEDMLSDDEDETESNVDEIIDLFA